MERFNSDFNDVDIVSGRPFSAGHPDGVWLAAIIYGFPLVLSVLSTFVLVCMAIFGPDSNDSYGEIVIQSSIASAVLCVLFVPMIVLMFKRSKYSLAYSIVLLVAAIIGASLMFSTTQLLVAVVVAQAYLVYYLYGLKKDKILI